MTEVRDVRGLDQITFRPVDGIWAIAPREGVMTDRDAAAIADGLREVGVRGVIFRAPVRIAPLSYEHILDIARRLVDLGGHPDFDSERHSLISDLEEALDALDRGNE